MKTYINRSTKLSKFVPTQKDVAEVHFYSFYFNRIKFLRAKKILGFNLSAVWKTSLGFNCADRTENSLKWQFFAIKRDWRRFNFVSQYSHTFSRALISRNFAKMAKLLEIAKFNLAKVYLINRCRQSLKKYQNKNHACLLRKRNLKMSAHLSMRRTFFCLWMNSFNCWIRSVATESCVTNSSNTFGGTSLKRET